MIKKIFKHLRTKVFAGILVILPLGITFLVLDFVFHVQDSILAPLVPEVDIYLFRRSVPLPGLGILAFFVLLYLIGVIATNVLGRKLIHWTDKLFINIPVVKNIYSSSKQLTDAFSTTKKVSFRQAVFVEFPQEGNFVLGFITNEVTDLEDEKKLTVFIPTGFAPPAGHLLFLSKEKVFPSQMTVEEAIKTIMSVGIVTPSRLTISLTPGKSGKEPIENSEGMKYLNSKVEGGP
jgi:uncharacterized membrane protein